MSGHLGEAGVGRVVCEPGIGAWAARGSLSAEQRAARTAIYSFAFDPLDRRAAALDASRPVIATGHQCAFWHPGILAKLLAVVHAAERHDAQALHLIVDHDQHPASTLDVLRRSGDALHVKKLRLGQGHEDTQTPLCFRPPLDRHQLAAQFSGLASDASCVIDHDQLRLASEAATKDGPWLSLADQITAITFSLLRERLGPAGSVAVLRSSQLLLTPPGKALVQRVLADARGCVRAYNAAVAAHPEAGVAPLLEHRNWVELPLWHLAGGRRRRVWADLTDSAPLLVDEALEPIEPGLFHPAPRALLLSAFMRSFVADRFVHGTGGAVYDRATEAWWQAWRSQKGQASLPALQPNAVVTADVYLKPPADLPVAEPAELAHARWYAHHLPHNIDRVLGLDDAHARRKRALLLTMDDDRDPHRRRAAFDEIHAINHALQQAHPRLMEAAKQQREQARQGVRNRALLARRDWPFLAYAPRQIDELAAALHQPLAAG